MSWPHLKLRSGWDLALAYSCDNRVFELLWVIIGEVFVGVVYNPPKPSYDLESFLDYLEATVDEISCKFPTSEIVMVGDFNQLLDTDLTQRTGLTQIVDQPTRGSNILDRICESSPMYTGVKVVTSTVKSFTPSGICFLSLWPTSNLSFQPSLQVGAYADDTFLLVPASNSSSMPL